MTKRNGVISCSLFLLLTITFDNAAAKQPQKSAEVSAISLDVLRVKACAVGQGCSTVGGPKQWNLFDLAEGKTDFANQVLMPAKTHELRLMLGSKSTITVDGQTYSLTVPSGQVSGLKLKGNKVFASASGFLKSIRLNFDLAKGLVVQAKKVKGKGKKDKDTLVYSYSLKPVIQVSSAQVTPMPENMAAVLVRPNKSSYLSLGDNFSMIIPSGAISESTFVFAEETKSSMISSIITLGPEGTVFSIPVQVQVKYYPEAIPGDYPESELVVLHDFREIPTQIDMTGKKLSGEISHFSTVRGGVKEKVPVKIGKIIYERRNDPPVHIIYFDKNANNYELRLISDMNPDRTINLQTISKISGDNKAVAAINGFYWNGDEGTTEGKGTLATTTIMNDVLMNKYSGSEVLLGFGRNEQGLLLKRMTTNRTSGEQAEFEEEFRNEFGKDFDQAKIGDKNENPTIDNIMHNLIGTTTTLMRDGECKGSGKDDWWSAIGYGKDKVVMISSDPANYFTTSVKDTDFCDTFIGLGVTDAVRLDGGPSVGLYYKADNQLGNHVNPITSSSIKYKYGTARHIAYAIGLIESQYVPPPDESCPNGNGLYCGDGQLGRDKNTLYYCKDGNYDVREQCSNGCENNKCKSGQTSCPYGTGLYCGKSSLGQNEDTLYYCKDGNYDVREQCSNGCEVMPPNVDDKCKDVPITCPYGNGYYCGKSSLGQNEDTLYYCKDGNYDIHEQCSNGCQIMPPYVDDVCK